MTMTRRMLRLSLPIVVVVLLACAPLVVDDYGALVLNTAATFGLVAVGLNLLSGGTGQFSLGHGGFYAIGAFTAAILGGQYGWPFWAGVPAGGLLAAVIGMALGVPTLRLSGPYLAIATLGFGLLTSEVLNNADWAGGRAGLSLSAPQIGSYAFTDRSIFWVVLAILVLGMYVARNVLKGPTGRAFVSLRESERAAQASGVNIAYFRVVAFVLSALYAGIAGGLYANWSGYVSAGSFGLPLSISFVAMVVLGGLGSTGGALAGAVFLTALSQLLQGQAQLSNTLYGLIIVAVLLVLPGGLAGLLTLGRRLKYFHG